MPTTNREKAESLVLSEGYPGDGEYISRSEAELQAFSHDIKQGRSIAFDEAEIAQIIKMGEELDSIPRVSLGRGLLQMFLPLAIVIIGIVYLVFFK